MVVASRRTVCVSVGRSVIRVHATEWLLTLEQLQLQQLLSGSSGMTEFLLTNMQNIRYSRIGDGGSLREMQWQWRQ